MSNGVDSTSICGYVTQAASDALSYLKPRSKTEAVYLGLAGAATLLGAAAFGVAGAAVFGIAGSASMIVERWNVEEPKAKPKGKGAGGLPSSTTQESTGARRRKKKSANRAVVVVSSPKSPPAAPNKTEPTQKAKGTIAADSLAADDDALKQKVQGLHAAGSDEQQGQDRSSLASQTRQAVVAIGSSDTPGSTDVSSELSSQKPLAEDDADANSSARRTASLVHHSAARVFGSHLDEVDDWKLGMDRKDHAPNVDELSAVELVQSVDQRSQERREECLTALPLLERRALVPADLTRESREVLDGRERQCGIVKFPNRGNTCYLASITQTMLLNDPRHEEAAINRVKELSRKQQRLGDTLNALNLSVAACRSQLSPNLSEAEIAEWAERLQMVRGTLLTLEQSHDEQVIINRAIDQIQRFLVESPPPIARAQMIVQLEMIADFIESKHQKTIGEKEAVVAVLNFIEECVKRGKEPGSEVDMRPLRSAMMNLYFTLDEFDAIHRVWANRLAKGIEERIASIKKGPNPKLKLTGQKLEKYQKDQQDGLLRMQRDLAFVQRVVAFLDQFVPAVGNRRGDVLFSEVKRAMELSDLEYPFQDTRQHDAPEFIDRILRLLHGEPPYKEASMSVLEMVTPSTFTEWREEIETRRKLLVDSIDVLQARLDQEIPKERSEIELTIKTLEESAPTVASKDVAKMIKQREKADASMERLFKEEVSLSARIKGLEKALNDLAQLESSIFTAEVTDFLSSQPADEPFEFVETGSLDRSGVLTQAVLPTFGRFPLPMDTETHNFPEMFQRYFFESYEDQDLVGRLDKMSFKCALRARDGTVLHNIPVPIAARRRQVKGAPPMLVLPFNRFGVVDGLAHKNTKKVEQMSEIITIPDEYFGEEAVYRLDGIIIHKGSESIEHGHYVAYTRKLDQDGQWQYFWCDDAEIFPNTQPTITPQQNFINWSSKCYVPIYVRIQ